MARSTLILSDTHLGRPGKATADALQPLWQGVDELIINGDIAEVQIPWLRSAAVREVDRLDELTRRDGVQLTLISGNHDAYLTDRRCIEMADGRILVMHGDALHPSVAPWTRSAKTMARLTARALANTAPADREKLHTRLTIAQHVGHSEFLEEYVLSSRGESSVIKALCRPWEVPPVMWYWKQEPGLAEQFMKRYAPHARYLIVGHSHHPGVWQRGERTIINTGAFSFPGRPWCVLIKDDELCVHRIRKKKGSYYRVDKPIASRSDASFSAQRTDSAPHDASNGSAQPLQKKTDHAVVA